MNRTDITVALVLVSHSKQLAESVATLARQMAGEHVKIFCPSGAGPDGSELGTDATRIVEALELADTSAGTIMLVDMGSAILSAEMALELTENDIKSRVTLSPAPFVEGAVAAAVAASAGLSREAISRDIADAMRPKREHLAPSETGATSAIAASDSSNTTSQNAIVQILDPAGLHARPAARIVALAGTFAAKIAISVQGNPKPAASTLSLVSLMGLGARYGDYLQISADGNEARDALKAMVRLVETFASASPEKNVPITLSIEKSGRAIPVSPGIGLGPVIRMQQLQPVVPDHKIIDVTAEVVRLNAAIASVCKSLENQAASAKSASTASSDILAIQIGLLHDPILLDQAHSAIQMDKLNATAAFAQSIEHVALLYRQMESDYLKARETDLRDAGRAVLTRLLGIDNKFELPGVGPAFVLLADDLPPSVAVELSPDNISGVIDLRGGPTSHAAILLRGMGIAYITNAAELVPSGVMEIGFDGATGEIWPDPDPATRELLEKRSKQLAKNAAKTIKINGKATLADGTAIQLHANVANAREAEVARARGAGGIGLLRTEMMFLDRSDAPTEDEQFSTLSSILAPFSGLPVVIRTLDAGGDKPVPFLKMAVEANPFLGVRGLRLSLREPEIFGTQLRAILRAGHGHDLRIMLPMVTEPLEVDAARKEISKAHENLLKRGIAHKWPVSLGIMVEVPAAALLAKQLSSVADFFSIGTNDLTQYTLAAERGHPELGRFADAAHPAVLDLVAHVAEIGKSTGKSVSVCGEAAGDPVVAQLLVGAGIKSLSMSTPRLGIIAEALTGKTIDGLATLCFLARATANADTARQAVQ